MGYYCTEGLAFLPFTFSMCTFLDPVYMWELTYIVFHVQLTLEFLNPTYNTHITYKWCLFINGFIWEGEIICIVYC